MATFSAVAVASMDQHHPTIGFVAKEGVVTALLHESAGGSPWGLVALIGVVLGPFSRRHTASDSSGAHSAKKDAGGIRVARHRVAGSAVRLPRCPGHPVGAHHRRRLATPLLDIAFAPYADKRRRRRRAWRHPRIPRISPCGTASSRRCGSRSAPSPSGPRLRGHGAPIVESPHPAVHRGGRLQRRPERNRPFVRAHDELHPARLTAGLRRDDLRRVRRRRGHGAARRPGVARPSTPSTRRFSSRRTAHDRRRNHRDPRGASGTPASCSSPVTGLGMVLLFATSGAPDLALTQILVETVTLVTFALVLQPHPVSPRRAQRLGMAHRPRCPWGRSV